MNLSEHTLERLAPFFINQTGKELVTLFNNYGFLDKYDYNNGGLPDIGKKNGQRPSKTQYVEKRLNDLNGKNELRKILEEVFNRFKEPESTIPLVNEILNKENYGVVSTGEHFIIEGGAVEVVNPILNEAHFLGIQNQILAILDSAKVSISVAMAWFTNDVLFNKLLEKANEGLEVKVAIFNDGVNAKHGVDLDKLENYKIRGSRGGLMHNKFCVVDNQIVINGSYNWSTNAETRNDENISVHKDPQLATKYSVEFRNLIKS